MTDDALRALWTEPQSPSMEIDKTAMAALLGEYEVAQKSERLQRRVAIVAEACLFPALLWCTAFGRTPLVRGGFALMAVGTGVVLFALWMNRAWSRQALPGPANSRAHLLNTQFLLARQATLLRTAPLWCAPLFVGGLFISGWLYQEQNRSEGYLLAGLIAGAWLVSAANGISRSRKLDAFRSRTERLLDDWR